MTLPTPEERVRNLRDKIDWFIGPEEARNIASEITAAVNAARESALNDAAVMDLSACPYDTRVTGGLSQAWHRGMIDHSRYVRALKLPDPAPPEPAGEAAWIKRDHEHEVWCETCGAWYPQDSMHAQREHAQSETDARVRALAREEIAKVQFIPPDLTEIDKRLAAVEKSLEGHQQALCDQLHLHDEARDRLARLEAAQPTTKPHTECPYCQYFIPAGEGHQCIEYRPSPPSAEADAARRIERAIVDHAMVRTWEWDRHDGELRTYNATAGLDAEEKMMNACRDLRKLRAAAKDSPR